MRAIVFLLLISMTMFTACSKTVKPKPDDNAAAVTTQQATPMPQPSSPNDYTVVPTQSSRSYEVTRQVPQTVMYKAVLGPFFKVSAYVPYKVKVSFERHIYSIRCRVADDSQLKVNVISFYPKGNKQQEIFATQRANNLVYYAKWKEKMSSEHFNIKVVPTTDAIKFYKIVFNIMIPSSVKIVKERKVVYYAGSKKVPASADSKNVKGDQDLVAVNQHPGDVKPTKQDVDEAYITNEKDSKPQDLKDHSQDNN